MNVVQFYRWSLGVPPLMLAVLLLLPETGALAALRGIGYFGLALGGVPYVLLAGWLCAYSRQHSVHSLERALLWSPLLFAPLVVVWIFSIFLLDRSGPAGLSDDLRTALVFSVFAGGYALLLGYVSVGGVFLLRYVLQRSGVFENAQS